MRACADPAEILDKKGDALHYVHYLDCKWQWMLSIQKPTCSASRSTLGGLPLPVCTQLLCSLLWCAPPHTQVTKGWMNG